MSEKRIYTREEKIMFYSKEISRLEAKLAWRKKRLEKILSPDYQDWNNSITDELLSKMEQQHHR